jgi:hypothetical protein
MSEQIKQELGGEQVKPTFEELKNNFENDKDFRYKVLNKLKEIQEAIDDDNSEENKENYGKAYEYVLSTPNGAFVLSHEVSNIGMDYIKIKDQDKVIDVILKAIESGHLQV